MATKNQFNPTQFKISPTKLAELLAKARDLKQIHTLAAESKIDRIEPAPDAPLFQLQSNSTIEIAIQGIGKHGEAITYNKEQQQFITLASNLESCILIGAAGTGKTTCMMGAINTLIHSGKISIFSNIDGHKHLRLGTPGIVACSFTRRAVSNLRKAMPSGMYDNCITIHKLLEYQPVYYEIDDPITELPKKTMRFEPSRNRFNPLPSQITTIIIDESSMVSVDLFKQLLDALTHSIQFIFLGDIQQLPPIFGPAILGFKMLELPTVELTQVYRQALESPIIRYATDIKDGIEHHFKEKTVEDCPKGKVTFHPWKKKLSADNAMYTFCQFIKATYDAGQFNPETDVILIPFNKAFGTLELNRFIANHIAKKRNAVVWEIIAGFNKLYFSVGDKVLYDKEDATITHIARNAEYYGKRAARESVTLDYWGHDPVVHVAESESEEDMEAMLESMAEISEKDEDRVRAASHIITVQMDDSGQELDINTASDLNALLISYALTIHKAQGSEWDKVFLVFHQSHATMIQRELLYTAVTRAAKELYVICEKDTFEKGVKSQKIKGSTLAEKAEFFKGKLDNNGGNY